MNILQAIVLGIVQGLTEFLPISSSAHLVIVPFLLGWHFPEDQSFVFNVLVQMGTLLAVIIYFWHDLVEIIVAFVQGIIHLKPFETSESRLGWLLILATIPAGALGFLLQKSVEAAFTSPLMTGFFLLLTAALLVLAEIIGKRTRSLRDLNWKDALWIGFAQVISIFPGVSRSGSTIAGGMTRNLDRELSARFAFLMSIPIMLAAGGLSLFDTFKTPGLSSFLPIVAVGFIAAAIVGYLSIRWLLRFLTHRPLYVFAVYCTLAGVITILLAHG